MNKGKDPHADVSVLQLINKIRSKAIDPRALSADNRRRCVEQLISMGYTTAEIAEVLKVSDRTIIRDRKAIQEFNKLVRDEKFVSVFVGRLVQEAELVVNRMRQASRDRDTPSPVKIDAERSCYQVISDLTKRLQSLGYLPVMAQRLEAHLSHDPAQPLSYEQIKVELLQLQSIAGDDAEVKQALKQIEDEVNRSKHTDQIQRLTQKVEISNNDPKHELPSESR